LHHRIHRRRQRTSPCLLSPTRNKSATPKVDTPASRPELIVCAPCTPSQWIARLPEPSTPGQSIITVTKQFFPLHHCFILLHVVAVSHPAIDNTLLPTASTPFR